MSAFGWSAQKGGLPAGSPRRARSRVARGSGQPGGARVWGGVAQIFNLPYRTIAFCGALTVLEALEFTNAWPISNRRNSRVQLCATGRGLAQSNRWRIVWRPWATRSVLECGSPLPLWNRS
jgi:hypothetical protein